MRGFGYDVYGTIIEPEAKVVREIADRIVLGEPIMSIVRNLNDRGITTAYGSQFDGSTIRTMMRSKRISGRGAGNQRVKPFPAIITEQLHDKVLEILAQPERRRHLGKAHRVYVGTGWLRCGRCAKVMPPKGGTPPFYACDTRVPYKGCGRMRIPAEPTDQIIVAKVLARIAQPAVRANIAKAATDVHGGLDRMNALNDQVKAAIAADAAKEDIEALESELDLVVAEYRPIERWGRWFSVRGNLTPAKLAQWWTEADTRRRQDLLSCVLDHVDVLPLPRTASIAPEVQDRLEFVWLV